MEIDGHSRLNVEWTSKYYFQNPAPLNVESNLLVLETKAYIWEAGFEPIIDILLEKSANATLVQCFIERWWDTTHTFHIVEREMTVTSYDFYYMIGLSFEGVIISLDGVSSIQLGFNRLERKYSTKTICYFDLVSDYMLLQ